MQRDKSVLRKCFDDLAPVRDAWKARHPTYHREVERLCRSLIPPGASVLEIGCGTGRLSIPMARRAKSVTAIDSAEKMLAHCRRNAQEAGVTNLEVRSLDWKDAVLGQNLEPHDIVIASRSPGLADLIKTISFARKYVVLIAWANAPNIPMILGDLFAGTGQDPRPPARPLSDPHGISTSDQSYRGYRRGYQ